MAGIVNRLAQNVRRFREQLALTQSELARRAGVSKAAVSQLEAGASNPTVETVWALAQALGRPFSDLTGDHEPAGVTVVRADQGEWIGGEVITSRFLHRLDAPGVVEIYRVRLHPGQVHHSDAHARGLTEQLILNQGRARIGPRDAAVVIGAGDSASFPADGPHLYEALDGTAEGVLLMHYPVLLAAPARPQPAPVRGLPSSDAGQPLPRAG
jgi:transcriptional regulator with XRE-family HTH domain